MFGLKTVYETDFYLWLEETGQALQDGNLERLDRENLLEENEAMGRSDRRSIKKGRLNSPHT
jgi:hypothetical protein